MKIARVQWQKLQRSLFLLSRNILRPAKLDIAASPGKLVSQSKKILLSMDFLQGSSLLGSLVKKNLYFCLVNLPVCICLMYNKGGREYMHLSFPRSPTCVKPARDLSSLREENMYPQPRGFLQVA